MHWTETLGLEYGQRPCQQYTVAGASSGPFKLLVEEGILCLMASSKESQVASSLLYLCHARM